MVDTIPPAKRSEVMAAVRSRGNRATELIMASLLRAHHIAGWRRHLSVPGHPDFVFRKERLALFIDGCFWHGCRWHCRMPKSNMDYWENKIQRNKRRDKEVNLALRNQGWKVLRIWEHSLHDPEKLVAILRTHLERE